MISSAARVPPSMAPVELIRTSPSPYISSPSCAALRRCYRGDLPARLFIPGALRISRGHYRLTHEQSFCEGRCGSVQEMREVPSRQRQSPRNRVWHSALAANVSHDPIDCLDRSSPNHPRRRRSAFEAGSRQIDPTRGESAKTIDWRQHSQVRCLGLRGNKPAPCGVSPMTGVRPAEGGEDGQ